MIETIIAKNNKYTRKSLNCPTNICHAVFPFCFINSLVPYFSSLIWASFSVKPFSSDTSNSLTGFTISITVISLLILYIWYYIYERAKINAPFSYNQIVERNIQYEQIVFPYLLLQGIILLLYLISYLYINHKIKEKSKI